MKNLVVHERAVVCAKNLKRAEAELLSALQRVDETQVYLELGYSSLHRYAVGALKLSEDQAYNFTRVAKKAVEVPALKMAIEDGRINVSKARRIVSVIEEATQEEWIKKAATLSQKELERAVVKANPREAMKDRIAPVNEDLVEIRITVPKEVEELLERVQDLESQRISGAPSLGDALKAALDTYVTKFDPLKKAERSKARKAKAEAKAKAKAKAEAVPAEAHAKTGVASAKQSTPAKPKTSPKSKPPKQPIFASRRIPSEIAHQVMLRDRGQCTFKGCNATRWIEVHHIKPWSLGGTHALENLTTLCHAHHKALHDHPAIFASRRNLNLSTSRVS